MGFFHTSALKNGIIYVVRKYLKDQILPLPDETFFTSTYSELSASGRPEDIIRV